MIVALVFIFFLFAFVYYTYQSYRDIRCRHLESTLQGRNYFRNFIDEYSCKVVGLSALTTVGVGLLCFFAGLVFHKHTVSNYYARSENGVICVYADTDWQEDQKAYCSASAPAQVAEEIKALNFSIK